MPPNPRETSDGSDAPDDPDTNDGSNGADSAASGPDGRGWTPPVSRRRMLRTLVGTGYGVGVAAALEGTNVLRGGDGDVSVAYALVHDDQGDPTDLVERTTSVPAAWHDGLARAFELRDELVEWGVDGLRGLFVVPGSFDNPTASLSLTVADGEVRDRLRERVADVAVELDVSILDAFPARETESGPAEPITLADVGHTSVPGGVVCSTNTGDQGSLAPGLYDVESGRRWFATANHIYGAAGMKRTGHAGEPLFVKGAENTRKIGEVVRGYPSEDVVRVRPVEDVSPASAVYGERSVVGQFTRFGLAMLKARGQPIEKIGAFSGHTSGPIKGIDGVTCYAGEVCKAGQLKWGSESAIDDGDSGSVNYRPDPENPDRYVLVGGFNSARTWWPGANFVWGTGAHHLVSARGLHF